MKVYVTTVYRLLGAKNKKVDAMNECLNEIKGLAVTDTDIPTLAEEVKAKCEGLNLQYKGRDLHASIIEGIGDTPPLICVGLDGTDRQASINFVCVMGPYVPTKIERVEE